MGWEMCELQRNDVKETLSVSQSPFKYASAQRRGFKSADVTVTETVIPSVPRWFPKKGRRESWRPLEHQNIIFHNHNVRSKSIKLKVSGASKAFHLNCQLYVKFQAVTVIRHKPRCVALEIEACE